VLGIAGALFAGAMTVMAAVARALGFSREDRIAAMFCGSKKTLASGVPMAKLIFGAQPGLGLILLPIMIYHPLQLVICGVIAERWRRE
jgi:sodium/bile acid cotransporter 7